MIDGPLLTLADTQNSNISKGRRDKRKTRRSAKRDCNKEVGRFGVEGVARDQCEAQIRRRNSQPRARLGTRCSSTTSQRSESNTRDQSTIRFLGQSLLPLYMKSGIMPANDSLATEPTPSSSTPSSNKSNHAQSSRWKKLYTTTHALNKSADTR